MTSRGVFYEGLAWAAMSRLYGDGVEYEPSRDRHTCHRLCEFRRQCRKPRVLKRLIHTTPDFLAPGEPPLFAHVCYWDSKETSHAKFWRTLSEIAELKLFVPGSRSLAIVFEARQDGDSFAARGWYEQFLEALRAIFDRAVFFDSADLPREHQRVKRRLGLAAGAAAIHELMRPRRNRFRSVEVLSEAIRAAANKPPPAFDAPAVWRLERDFCATLEPYAPTPHEGHRLRNATLQLVLLAGVFRLAPAPLIDRLQSIATRPRDRFDGREDWVSALAQLPIARQAGATQYVLTNPRRGIGRPSTGDFSDDLAWLLEVWRNESLPLGRTAFLRGLEATRDALLSSPQVIECLESVRAALNRDTAIDATFEPDNWTPAQWVAAYESVPSQRHYNRYAELLLEAVGLGTYPLVRALQQRWPRDAVKRFDVRALYSNRRAPKYRAGRRRLLRHIVRLLPEQVDWPRVCEDYIRRKCERVVGAQSAVNPLMCFAVAVLESCDLAAGVRLLRDVYLPTLPATLEPSRQLAVWRVSLALQRGQQIIPLFLSGMRGSSDCAHKAREFAGHLRMARYAWTQGRVTLTAVREGVAVLEGGYSDDDKRALRLAGFRICSLGNLARTLARMELVEHAAH